METRACGWRGPGRTPRRRRPWGIVGFVATGAVERIGRGPLAAVLFFWVTLSPVLGFVDYGYMQFSLVADRHQYLAGSGAMALVIGAVAQGVDRLPRTTRRTLNGLGLSVLALLGALTWQQTGIYRSNITFFSHIVNLNPRARRVLQSQQSPARPGTL